MPTPKILLLARGAIEAQLPELKSYLQVTPAAMAIAQCDADKDAAMQVSEVVGTFNGVTAIVADFAACMCVNDDGSVEPIALPEPAPVESEPLIQVVSA